MSEPTNTQRSAEGTSANANPAADEVGQTTELDSIPRRVVSEVRYKHMGSEWDSHLQAMRGIKRRSLRGSDDFPGSYWESVDTELYGPETNEPVK